MTSRLGGWTAAAAACGGAVLGALAATSLAQEARSFGLFGSHDLDETYAVELGIQPGGRPGLPQKQRESRDLLKVPTHYGELVHVVADAGNTVFWFRAEDGTLRNVAFQGATTAPLAIVRGTTFDLETRAR